MSNVALTTAEITNEALMVLENELMLVDKIDHQYDDRYGIDGAKIGYTLNIRKPIRPLVSAGPQLQVQDYVETYIPVTLTNQAQIALQFITSDRLLTIDDFSKRVLKPMVAQMANSIDLFAANAMRLGTANIIGTPGTSPTTLTPFLSAGAILDTEGVPRDGERYMVLDQFSQASMVGSLTGLFNPQISISEQYKKGLMARQTVGFDWYMDQNISNQTYGSWAGAPKYGTAGTSSALLSSGWADNGTLYCVGFSATTAVVNVGDTFTIAGVFMANPQNRQTTKQLRTFVVRPFVGTPSNGTFAAVTDGFGNVVGGTYTSDGSGFLQLQVAVAIITGGQFQNVGAAPANNAVLTPTGASGAVSPQSLAFHRDAFTLVSADLPLPGGVEEAARASHKDVGVSMRLITQYTIGNDALPSRLDVLYGVAPLYRELACRVAG